MCRYLLLTVVVAVLGVPAGVMIDRVSRTDSAHAAVTPLPVRVARLERDVLVLKLRLSHICSVLNRPPALSDSELLGLNGWLHSLSLAC